MIYDRILHFVLSQLDPIDLDAALRLWCTRCISQGADEVVEHVRSCIFGDDAVSNETGESYTSLAALFEAEGPDVTWYWQPVSPELLAASVKMLPEHLVHRHLRALAERAYPDLSGDANRFTPAEHPEDWFAALLRDMFRRQRHGSG